MVANLLPIIQTILIHLLKELLTLLLQLLDDDEDRAPAPPPNHL